LSVDPVGARAAIAVVYRRWSAHLESDEGVVTFSDKSSDCENAVLREGNITVPLTTLDALTTPHEGPIRLLKVDVEGYERFVFQGTLATMLRTECLYFEADEANFAGFDYRTCLWRVLGSSDIRDFSQWSALDLKYIREWSLLLDLAIIARTGVVVVRGSGGY
jgi:hypothetical protein